MLVFLTVAVMLIVAYAHSREGVLTAVAALVNVFLAGLVAFNFFEPAATFLDPHVESSGLGGGEDAFVHASVLERSGIDTLNEGQRVLIDIAEGRKGPEAVRVRLA